MRFVIAAGSGGTNLGDSFLRAARELNQDATLLNTRDAYAGGVWLKRINWYLRGKRPVKLNAFSKSLLQVCREKKHDVLLTTGLAPIDWNVLQEVSKMGICRINFLTDDPWNPAHYASWFLQALPYYDIVLSPRHANISDLKRVNKNKIYYLPFGYDPEFFYPEEPTLPDEIRQFTCDVVFAGGADRERVFYISSLIRAGFDVALYGDYWSRYSETRANLKGYADPRTLRLTTSMAKVVLGLVRRANRDGHAMRSYEVPAMKGCMLVEDTADHRALFGAEGEASLYFSTIPEMIEKTRWLLTHATERKRLAEQAYQQVTQGKHTYRDRLEQIVELVNL